MNSRNAFTVARTMGEALTQVRGGSFLVMRYDRSPLPRRGTDLYIAGWLRRIRRPRVASLGEIVRWPLVLLVSHDWPARGRGRRK